MTSNADSAPPFLSYTSDLGDQEDGGHSSTASGDEDGQQFKTPMMETRFQRARGRSKSVSAPRGAAARSGSRTRGQAPYPKRGGKHQGEVQSSVESLQWDGSGLSLLDATARQQLWLTSAAVTASGQPQPTVSAAQGRPVPTSHPADEGGGWPPWSLASDSHLPLLNPAVMSVTSLASPVALFTTEQDVRARWTDKVVKAMMYADSYVLAYQKRRVSAVKVAEISKMADTVTKVLIDGAPFIEEVLCQQAVDYRRVIAETVAGLKEQITRDAQIIGAHQQQTAVSDDLKSLQSSVLHLLSQISDNKLPDVDPGVQLDMTILKDLHNNKVPEVLCIIQELRNTTGKYAFDTACDPDLVLRSQSWCQRAYMWTRQVVQRYRSVGLHLSNNDALVIPGFEHDEQSTEPSLEAHTPTVTLSVEPVAQCKEFLDVSEVLSAESAAIEATPTVTPTTSSSAHDKSANYHRNLVVYLLRQISNDSLPDVESDSEIDLETLQEIHDVRVPEVMQTINELLSILGKRVVSTDSDLDLVSLSHAQCQHAHQWIRKVADRYREAQLRLSDDNSVLDMVIAAAEGKLKDFGALQPAAESDLLGQARRLRDIHHTVSKFHALGGKIPGLHSYLEATYFLHQLLDVMPPDIQIQWCQFLFKEQMDIYTVAGRVYLNKMMELLRDKYIALERETRAHSAVPLPDDKHQLASEQAVAIEEQPAVMDHLTQPEHEIQIQPQPSAPECRSVSDSSEQQEDCSIQVRLPHLPSILLDFTRPSSSSTSKEFSDPGQEADQMSCCRDMGTCMQCFSDVIAVCSILKVICCLLVKEVLLLLRDGKVLQQVKHGPELDRPEHSMPITANLAPPWQFASRVLRQDNCDPCHSM